MWEYACKAGVLSRLRKMILFDASSLDPTLSSSTSMCRNMRSSSRRVEMGVIVRMAMLVWRGLIIVSVPSLSHAKSGPHDEADSSILP